MSNGKCSLDIQKVVKRIYIDTVYRDEKAAGNCEKNVKFVEFASRVCNDILGGVFNYLYFHPYLGKMNTFD